VIRALLFALLATAVSGADWPAFHGPRGVSKAEGRGYSESWGPTENIRWQLAVAPGNGSPIVSNGRILFIDASADGRTRSLRCVDRKDGKELWARSVSVDDKEPTHKTNFFGSSTPVANGKTVLAWHSSGGLHAYDFTGEPLWSRQFGNFRHMWGYATSPVINGERVILLAGPGKDIFVTALDLNSGQTLWSTPEPGEGDGERNDAGHYMGTWSTPRITEIGGKAAAVCSMPTRVNAYDLGSGALIWSIDGLRGKRRDLAYSPPMIDGEMGVAIGGYQGPGLGFRLDGNRLWRHERNPQNIGSGVIIDGNCYLAHAGPARIQCVEVESGKTLWKVKSPGGEKFWGSIVAAEGRLYVTGQRGRTIVFAANPQRFELLSQNDLGESSNSTPAFSDGEIFLRTFAHLYCIAQ
jgi:outer membrane protein assembly factor BamB